MRPRRWPRLAALITCWLAAGAMLGGVLIVRGQATWSTSTDAVAPTTARLFGTLATDDRQASREFAAGLRLAHVDLGWDQYEPVQGQFDTGYVDRMRTRVAALRQSGLRVVLGAGLDNPPAWVLNTAASQYVDQYGVVAPTLNLTFSQTVRTLAGAYLRHLVNDFGPASFWAIRIGSGGNVEALYPEAQDSAGNRNTYWAFDENAQGGSGRPVSVPPPPYPGWKPGERTYRGLTVTTIQVIQWYDWYIRAMVDGINWQIGVYRAAGFSGELQVLMPGLGSRPAEYTTSVDNALGGAGDPNQTMGRGAVWNMVIDNLAPRDGVVVYVSSVADGSGNDDLCQASDKDVSLDDPSINTWSATRWISFNADRYAMPKAGENPGQRDQPELYGPSMLSAAVRQAEACGLTSLMWAHDTNLYAAGASPTLDDYARAIAGSH